MQSFGEFEVGVDGSEVEEAGLDVLKVEAAELDDGHCIEVNGMLGGLKLFAPSLKWKAG